jgi:toluene methyl-monooxygenase electron transfer component
MLKRLFGRSAKTHTVQVEPFGATLTVGAKETILMAALKAGLPFPFECQVGSCTSCKSRLLEGEIKPLTDFAYVLEMDELKDGYILACQALAKSDLKIRVESVEDGAAPMPVVHTEGTVSSVGNLTHDIYELRIALDAPMNYRAGQYANLRVPGVEETRSYSFAAAPSLEGSNELVFHIRLVPGGEVSDWLTNGQVDGARIEVDGPHGVFWLRESDAPILCIAGGSGMAPVKAILEQAAQDKSPRRSTYLFGARTQADLYGTEDMDAVKDKWSGDFTFSPILSEEPDGSDWAGARGMVTEWIGKQDGLEIGKCHAYLCGPPVMIDAALPVLKDAGVHSKNIHFDKFTDRSHTSG